MTDLSQLSDAELMAQLQASQQQQVSAIHQNESGGAPDTRAGIVNPTSGARGSMQVMPATAAQPGFGIRPSNGTPQDDARVGREIYSAMLKKYNDPTTAAIAYNWGPGNTDEWLKNGADLSKLPDETVKYALNFQKQTGEGMPQQAAPAQNAAPVAQEPQGQPSVTPQSRTFLEQLGRQGGLFARAAGHGIADAAGALTQGFTRLMGVPDERDIINRFIDQITPAPEGRLEEGIGKATSALANPLNVVAGLAGGPATGVLSGLRSGAVTGAVSSAMQPTQQGETREQMLTRLAQDTLMGAAGGGVMGGIGAGIGRVLSPRTNPAVQRLMSEGVQPTPAQIGGRLTTSIEGQATSVPLTGPSVTAARENADKSLNRAIYARALDGVPNTKVPDTVGRAAVDDVGRQLSDSYQGLLPKLSMQADQQFSQDMASLVPQFGKLPADMRQTFNGILDDNILNQTSRTGVLNGTDLKAAESAIGQEAARYGRSSMPNDQRMAELLRDTQTVLRNTLERQNPQYQGELQAINRGYSVFSRLRDAQQRVTGGDDVPFTPAQFQAAVKAGDKSVGKGNFARGSLPLSQIADDAAAVMGKRVPDSGTAGRIGLMGLLGGAGIATHPIATLTGIGGTGLYANPTVQKLLVQAMTQRPDWVRSFGGGLQSFSPAIGGIIAPALMRGGS